MSFTIWFTGFSGAGKTTLSKAVYLELKKRGLKAEWLDGDIIRNNFSQELTFSKRDRDINVRRIGFVSHLLNKNNVISVVAAIAPYADARTQNRSLIRDYIEVFCNCNIEAVIKRDVKGLYKKALEGKIANFTGISDPYDRPENPEISAYTDKETVETSFVRTISYLEQAKLIPIAQECKCCSFTEKDELEWREHLSKLGYAQT